MTACRSSALSAVTAVFVMLLVGLGAPLGAAAFNSTDGTYIEYSGTWKNYAIDEPADVRENPATFGIICKGDLCGIYGTFAGTELPVGPIPGSIKVTSGTESLSLPGTGDACGGGGQQPITLTVTATATHALIILKQLPVDCGGGSRAGGLNNEWEGDFASGDPCVLDGHDCVAAAGGDLGHANSPTGGGTTTSQLSSGSWAAPSVLTALPTIADAPTAPSQLALAALLTVILVLLVAFPTALLNSAIEHGSERVSTAMARFRRKPKEGSGVEASGWWKAAVGVLIAATISGFVDPQFGFNVGSLRVVASIMISFIIEVIVGWWLLIWLVRRAHPAVSVRFEFKPATLLVVIVAVIFTRVTGFEPGIVFGLVAGVAFGTALALAGRARATLIGLGYGLAIAIVGWVAYSGLTAAAGPTPDGVQQFFLDTFSSFAIAGVAALPIALIPLRGLAGHQVFVWKRWVWVTAYAIGLFAFFFVLLPMPFSWEDVSVSLWTWILIYVLYAVVAIGLWLALAQPWNKEPEAPAAPRGDAIESERA